MEKEGMEDEGMEEERRNGEGIAEEDRMEEEEGIKEEEGMKEDGWEKIEKKGWGGGRDGEEEGIGRRKGLGGGWDREETPRRETCRRDSGW